MVVEQGLEEGDQLIINDLIPVIEGMPLVAISSKIHSDFRATEQDTEQPKSKQGVK